MADIDPSKTEGAEPKPRIEEPKPATPKVGEEGGQDPMMARLVARERELESTRKEAEALRAAVKKHERDARKGAVLSALYSEFPGLPAAEVRGAALVAADDGVIDLFAEDAKPVVDKLKEIRAARAKATPAKPAALQSLGGTPGTTGAARPGAVGNRLPI